MKDTFLPIEQVLHRTDQTTTNKEKEKQNGMENTT